MTDFRRNIGPPLPHVIETEIQGDVSLYDAKREKVLVLNTSASDVWRLCDGEQTSGQIVDLLANAYQVDPGTIRADVLDTIRQFVEEGFLTES